VEIEFDPKKSARNAETRGLPFELAEALEWDAAVIAEDRRRDYGERRFVALAPMHGRIYSACYCLRGRKRRIISFRKANKREERVYEKASDAASDATAHEAPDEAPDR
jgi:uncharacterized DUF497 family protein